MKIDKKYIILAVAIVVPFGLVALGLWKTFELLNKEVGDNEFNETE